VPIDSRFPLLTPPKSPVISRKNLEDYLEKRRRENELGSHFQIVATISTFEDRDILLKKLISQGFKLEAEYGNLYSFETTIPNQDGEGERNVPYFMFYDPVKGVHLFFTRARKTDDMPDTILSFIKSTRDISNLWIPPSLMHEITQKLEEKFGDAFQMSYFTAIRNANTHIRAERRPAFDRTIQYTGLDAKQSLRELEYLYGVYPKIIEVQIGATSGFRVDGEGIMTVRQASTASTIPVFETLDMIIERALPIADAVLSSRYEMKRIGSIEKWIQHPFLIEMPSGIRRTIERNFLAEVSSDDWQFMPILPHIDEEAPYLFGRFIDGLKSSSFDVEITEKKVRVYPIDKMDIGTALRFCQFINLSEDIHSKVGIVSEESKT